MINITHVGFARHTVSVAASQLFHCKRRATSGHAYVAIKP